MNIFRKKNAIFKSFVVIEFSYVFTINMSSTAESCMEQWIIAQIQVIFLLLGIIYVPQIILDGWFLT